MSIRFCKAALVLLTAAAMPAQATSPADVDYFGAALCQPPYSLSGATALYEAAEAVAKPDTSGLGAAVYHLPASLSRDGFTAQDVIFSGMAVGMLVDGEVAEKLAKTYDLQPKKSHLMGASTLGFARLLPDADQGMKDMGLISIVARQGPGLGGKTLLACEFVSNEDRASLEQWEEKLGAP